MWCFLRALQKQSHASTANFLSKLFDAMISERRVRFERKYKKIALSSGVHNVFDVWSRNYHLLAIRLPRIKNTCTMTGKYVVKGKKLRSEKSLAQMKERGKCKKNKSSLISMCQMTLDISHFKVRNLSKMDVAIL